MDKYTAFFALVEEIVYQELDETQQEQYRLEGIEVMNVLFRTREFPGYSEDELLFDFGFSPSEVDIRLAGITFMDVANALYYVNEDVASKRANGGPDKRVAISSHYIEQVLAAKGISSVLSNLIVSKYQDRLIKIIS